MKRRRRNVLSVDESLMDPPMLLMASILATTLWIALPSDGAVRGRLSEIERSWKSVGEEWRNEQAQTDRLRRSLAEIERRRARLSSPHDEATEKTDMDNVTRLRQALAARQTETTRLQAALDALDDKPTAAITSAPVAVRKGKDIIHLEIAQNRVIHVTDENYRVEEYVDSGGSTVLVASRRVRGETADQIAQPSSKLQRLLDGADPRQQMLGIILRSDSFPTFRRVREIARTRGIAIGWEPISGTDDKLYFTSGGGRGMAEQP